MDINIPTEVLRSFVAIADTGSFTQAADRVFRTQSAVSQQVTKLEQSFGKQLFSRQGRSVRLTADGDSLLGYARRILKLHDEAVSVISEPDVEGHVKFGIPDDYAIKYLPPILTTFAKACPRVELEILCAPTTELIKLKGAGCPDVSLVTCYISNLETEIVRREATIWTTSARHFSHEQDPVPLALFEEGCRVRQAALESLDRVGRSYRMAYSSPSHTGLICAVQAGLAVTALAKRSEK